MNEHFKILDLLNNIVVKLKLLEVGEAPEIVDAQNVWGGELDPVKATVLL
jgi:hypothetical protein